MRCVHKVSCSLLIKRQEAGLVMGGPVEEGTVVYAPKPTLALLGVSLWGGEVAFSVGPRTGRGAAQREGCLH